MRWSMDGDLMAIVDAAKTRHIKWNGNKMNRKLIPISIVFSSSFFPAFTRTTQSDQCSNAGQHNFAGNFDGTLIKCNYPTRNHSLAIVIPRENSIGLEKPFIVLSIMQYGGCLFRALFHNGPMVEHQQALKALKHNFQLASKHKQLACRCYFLSSFSAPRNSRIAPLRLLLHFARQPNKIPIRTVILAENGSSMGNFAIVSARNGRIVFGVRAQPVCARP